MYYTINFLLSRVGSYFSCGYTKVEPHLASDPNPGFVNLKHKGGAFKAELVNDPNRRTVAAVAPQRPLVAATPGAALAVLAFVACSGAPPAASDARQFAVASDLPFHAPKPITPSDLSALGLGVRGGVTDMESPPALVVASVSGHPATAQGSTCTMPKPPLLPSPRRPPWSASTPRWNGWRHSRCC